jgi:DNA-binding beta-propeller fold protein YncE
VKKCPQKLIAGCVATLFCVIWSVGAGAAQQPLELVHSTPLPEVTGGDFDHFAVDLAHHRLYSPSEVYGSLELFDLATGRHLKSATGLVKSPHLLVFLPGHNELFVADAADAACDVLDATDFHLLRRISLEPGPDAGVLDERSRILYLGNGGRKANSDFSYVSLISTDSKEVVGRIRLESATLKAMRINRKANRLYVSMRDKNAIAVIDLGNRTVVDTWSPLGLTSNAALAIDEDRQRVFVGSRNPGMLFVLDARTGKLITSSKTVETSDDITYDPARRRLFVSGSDGVDVFAQDTPDSYRLVQHLDLPTGKTSVYVPSLKQFYVVQTKNEQVPVAQLKVFRVNN